LKNNKSRENGYPSPRLLFKFIKYFLDSTALQALQQLAEFISEDESSTVRPHIMWQKIIETVKFYSGMDRHIEI